MKAWVEEHGRRPTDAELVEADLNAQREGPEGVDEYNAKWDEAMHQDINDAGPMPEDPEGQAQAAAEDEYNADVEIIERVRTPPGSSSN